MAYALFVRDARDAVRHSYAEVDDRAALYLEGGAPAAYLARRKRHRLDRVEPRAHVADELRTEGRAVIALRVVLGLRDDDVVDERARYRDVARVEDAAPEYTLDLHYDRAAVVMDGGSHPRDMLPYSSA